MLPPWVIDEIRRDEQRRRQKSDEGRRLPAPDRGRTPPRPFETENERPPDSSGVPVVVDIYGNDTPEGGVGDVVIR